MMKTIAFALLMLVFVLAACGAEGETVEVTVEVPAATSEPCSVESEAFISGIEAMAERWEDAVELASNTQRASLSEPIASLQALKREANSLDAPDCAMIAKENFVRYTEVIIDNLLDFMADRDEIGSRYELAMQNIIDSLSLEIFVESLVNIETDRHVGEIRVDYLASATSKKAVSYSDGSGNEIATEGQVKMPWSKTIWVDKGTDLSLDIISISSHKMSCVILVNGKVADEQHEENGWTLTRSCKATAD